MINTELALRSRPGSVRTACGHDEAVSKIAHDVPLSRLARLFAPGATRSVVYCGSCVSVIDAVINDYRQGRLDLDDFGAVAGRLAPLRPRSHREVRRFIRNLRKEG